MTNAGNATVRFLPDLSAPEPGALAGPRVHRVAVQLDAGPQENQLRPRAARPPHPTADHPPRAATPASDTGRLSPASKFNRAPVR